MKYIKIFIKLLNVMTINEGLSPIISKTPQIIPPTLSNLLSPTMLLLVLINKGNQ